MKNVLILGCPRSGTSMTAGLFENSGLFMGDISKENNEYDPKGVYEWRIVNDLNEAIIKKTINDLEKPYDTYFLTAIPWGTQIKTTEKIDSEIKKLTTRPFCYKDPRFAYTLPAWKPYLGDCKYIVTFRSPKKTIDSMDRLAKGWYGLSLGKEELINIWNSYYEHILNRYDNDWIFLHYDQLFERQSLDLIIEHTGVSSLNESFPEAGIAKQQDDSVIDDCESIYQKLCRLSGYSIL